MSKLEDIIKTQIKQTGPMRVSDFMALALSYPEHGYYMRRDPFGAQGDFTTAPEISQMFGELIGAWFADVWMKCGSPDPFLLLECGPGRGTLMADMLRATKGVSGFHDALDLHLMEMSPCLRDVQKETLSDYAPTWHDTIETVPDHAPIFIVGNEFFDALPVQHLVFDGGRWCERLVGLDGDALCFVLSEASSEGQSCLPDHLKAAKQGDLYEYSPLSVAIMNLMSARVKAQGGAMLFVDYGYRQDACGESLQAVYQHKYSDVFDHIGDSDLTAHVNFEALAVCAAGHGLMNTPVVEQGSFLNALGIGVRAKMLQQTADDVQQKDIDAALHRLTHKDEMGALFKVFATARDPIKMEGF